MGWLLHMSNKIGQAEVDKDPRSAHVQDADVSANWASRMPAEAELSPYCIILAKDVRLQTHGD